MNIFSFAKQYADQIGGQYTEYDSTKSIIVVPLTQGRFQTVLLLMEKSNTSDKQRAILTSKVCEYAPAIDLKELLEKNAKFDYSRFIIENGHIKLEASFTPDSVTEDDVKRMIQETALHADAFELKLTGKDIH